MFINGERTKFAKKEWSNYFDKSQMEHRATKEKQREYYIYI